MTKLISEIYLKIELQDIYEKVNSSNDEIMVNLLMMKRNLLIAYASEHYRHINWTDPKSYNDTETQSIIKSTEIIYN